MNPHYPADTQPTSIYSPRTEQVTNIYWSNFQVIVGIISMAILGGLILGLVYAMYFGLLQGLATGISHGLIAGSIWAIIWYCKWSD